METSDSSYRDMSDQVFPRATPAVPTPDWNNMVPHTSINRPILNDNERNLMKTPLMKMDSSGSSSTPSQSSHAHDRTIEVTLTPVHSFTPQSVNPHASMNAVTPMASGSSQAKSSIKIQNCVSTVSLACELKLLDIYCRTRFSEYNPARFQGLVMKILEPRATALVFRSGKIVCTGARNEHDSYVAARKFARIIQKLGFPGSVVRIKNGTLKATTHSAGGRAAAGQAAVRSATYKGIAARHKPGGIVAGTVCRGLYRAKFVDFKIQNFIATADLRFPVRLEALQQAHGQFTSYEPELFPGLVYRMVRPRVVLLIFVNGKIVFTGGKTRSDINEALDIIYPILRSYRKS